MKFKNYPSKKVKSTSTTKFESAYRDMLTNVTNFGLRPDNLPTTLLVAAFHALLLFIQTKLATINALRLIAGSNITGFAQQKEHAREVLANMAVNMMNAAYSYAIDVNNPVLAQQMVTSPSKLMEMKYLELIDEVGTAIENVEPFVTDGSLAAYNITPATLTSLQTIKDQAAVVFSNPRNALVNRVTINISIQKEMRECMYAISNKGDTLIYQFREEHVDYFNSYWGNRRLIDHTMSTQLRLTAVDQDGLPVRQGEVFIEGTDRSAFLDDNGYALVNHIPFGDHKVILTTIYGDFDYGVQHFKKGKSLTMDVVIDTEQMKVTKVAAKEGEIVEEV